MAKSMAKWGLVFWLVMTGAAVADETPVGLVGAEVVLLGEVHDNAAIHARQAELIAVIKPRALVFEMLTQEQASKATPEVRGDAATLEAALGWAQSGWPDFAMYYPVFEAAETAQVFGAAVPRGEARAAMKTGVSESFGTEAARFGLSRALPEAEQAAREHFQHMAHCEALPSEMLPMMVELQRLRDATLARAVLDALDATGGPVAVITGNGHARKDWGVPVVLELARPGVKQYSMGLTEAGGENSDQFDGEERFPAALRDDPCAVFEKG